MPSTIKNVAARSTDYYMGNSTLRVGSARKSYKECSGAANNKMQPSQRSLQQLGSHVATTLIILCRQALLIAVYQYLLLRYYLLGNHTTAFEKLVVKKGLQYGIGYTILMPVLIHLITRLWRDEMSRRLINVVDTRTFGLKPLTRLEKFCRAGSGYKSRLLCYTVCVFDFMLNLAAMNCGGHRTSATHPTPNLQYDSFAINLLWELSPPINNSFDNFEISCTSWNSVDSLCKDDWRSVLPDLSHSRGKTLRSENIATAYAPDTVSSLEWLSEDTEDYGLTVTSTGETTRKEFGMLCHISTAESELPMPTFTSVIANKQDSPADDNRGIESESSQRFVATFSRCVECFLNHNAADSHNCTPSCSDVSIDGEADNMIEYVQAVIGEDKPPSRQEGLTDESKQTSCQFSNVFRAAWLRWCKILLIVLCWYVWSKAAPHVPLVGYESYCGLPLYIRIGILATCSIQEDRTSLLFDVIPNKGELGHKSEGLGDKSCSPGDGSCRLGKTPVASEAVHENGLSNADPALQTGSQFASDPQQWLGDVLDELQELQNSTELIHCGSSKSFGESHGDLCIIQTTIGGDKPTTRAHVGDSTSSSTGKRARSSTKADQQSHRIPKRKKRSSRKGKSGDADSDDENDENEDCDHGRHVEEPTSLFACPFWKAHRDRNQRCFQKVLRRIPELKQHLIRVHTAPDWYCFKCRVDLVNEDGYQAHFRANQCFEATQDGPDLMRPHMLKHVKKRMPGRKPRDTWYDIYSTLFPDLPRPDSPYLIEENPECVQQMSNFLSMMSPETRQRILADISLQRGQITEPLRQTERIFDQAFQIFNRGSRNEEPIVTVDEQTTEQSPVSQGFDASYDDVSNGTGSRSLPSLAADDSGMSEGFDEFRAEFFASAMEDFPALLTSPSIQDGDSSDSSIQQLRRATASVDIIKSSGSMPLPEVHEYIHPSLLLLNQPQQPTYGP